MTITLKLKLEKRVEKVIDEALELAELGDQFISANKIAERIYDSEPELIEEVQRAWTLDRLAWMIGRRRRARWDQQIGRKQLSLPDPVFQNLPKTIFLRNGKRPRLLGTVLTETEDHLKLLRERFKNHPRVTQFEAVVELHRKWANIQRGITLAEAMRREAEDRDKS